MFFTFVDKLWDTIFFYNVPLSPVIKPKIANVSRETLEYIFEVWIHKKYVFRKMLGKITMYLL